MSPEMSEFLTNIGIAILIAVVGIIASIIVKRLLRVILARFSHATWTTFADDFAQLVILGVTGYFILDKAGAAGLIVVIITAATAAFAIGSERIAGNFIAGFNLLAQNYYRVGDFVTIGDHQGIITEITPSHTILKNFELDRIIVPNAVALDDVVINHSQISGFFMTVSVPVRGEHDWDKALEALVAAGLKVEGRVPDSEPEIFIEDFGADCVFYGIEILVTDPEKMDDTEIGKLRLTMAQALRENGFTVGKASER